jgi:hypothetical protein
MSRTGTLAGLCVCPLALREKTSNVIDRLGTLEARLAQRASALADPGLIEDDDTLFVDETEVVPGRREPSPQAMLGAFGAAISLLLIWVGVQLL